MLLLLQAISPAELPGTGVPSGKLGIVPRPIADPWRNELAVGTGARGAPRVGEQHEREQAGDLGIVGQRGVHAPGQPDRLAGEVGARRVGAAAARRTPR